MNIEQELKSKLNSTKQWYAGVYTRRSFDDLDDNELPNKLKKAQDELIKMKAELDEKNKLCLTQKHTIEDLNIEKKDLEEKFNNQKKLLDFYDEKAKKEEEDEKDPEKRDKIKQLEMKIMNLNDKIKDLKMMKTK